MEILRVKRERKMKKIIEMLIMNFLLRKKSEKLRKQEKIASKSIKFHFFLRKISKFSLKSKKNQRLNEKLHQFRLRFTQKIKPKVRIEYLTRAFSLWNQRYSKIKAGLNSLFSILQQKQVKIPFERLLNCRGNGEKTLKSSGKMSEFDWLLRSLEETHMKGSLYEETRVRKVHFAGEMDTSKVKTEVREICEDMQESWLSRCQRKEQERRADIHRELDSLQASLMSSLSSKGSRRYGS